MSTPEFCFTAPFKTLPFCAPILHQSSTVPLLRSDTSSPPPLNHHLPARRGDLHQTPPASLYRTVSFFPSGPTRNAQESHFSTQSLPPHSQSLPPHSQPASSQPIAIGFSSLQTLFQLDCWRYRPPFSPHSSTTPTFTSEHGSFALGRHVHKTPREPVTRPPSILPYRLPLLHARVLCCSRANGTLTIGHLTRYHPEPPPPGTLERPVRDSPHSSLSSNPIFSPRLV
jgi:hypothetical protein